MASIDDGTWEFSPFSGLTPEVVQALADEARRGYDPFDLRVQFVGRPRYEFDGDPLLPRIAFRVPPEVLVVAQRRADEEGRALSDLAAEALRDYLKAARRKSRGVRKTSGDS